jgi:hypothetical protein
MKTHRKYYPNSHLRVVVLILALLSLSYIIAVGIWGLYGANTVRGS